MSTSAIPPEIDAPAVRQCGRGPLSLALMDARNRTLHLLAQHLAADSTETSPDDPGPPAWQVAGQAAWFAEWWILRNPQRALGAACQADGLRLAPLLPQADEWLRPPSPPGSTAAPDPGTLRDYMLQQLEATLELLDKAEETEPGLHLYRAALCQEDARGEQLLVLAQHRCVKLPLQVPAPMAPRDALDLPATRWTLGSAVGGYAPALERPAHPVEVPPFEIDAQPVSWSQFVEFVDDAGYDRQELWHPDGWSWLQTSGRRAPRHVEQIGVASGAVLQTLFGKPTRLAAAQPVMHVSWWEADAWARWAGRRLPTEVEWEIAAVTASRRGFRWGDVHEWTAATLRPWPGFVPDAWAVHTLQDPQPHWGAARVRRGASFATAARQKHPRARGFALPGHDIDFVGFRTCAL
ncbi:MAG: SUMF1/EgtB/PvdO family nonheme iron enzyme [Ramlibacter sp.]